jgi:hypothetical protein
VFTNVHDLKFDIESRDGDISLQGIGRSEPSRPRKAAHLTQTDRVVVVARLQRGRGHFPFSWLLAVHSSSASLLQAQELTMEERRGISFCQRLLQPNGLYGRSIETAFVEVLS